jgi:hypothetical protein
MNPKRDRDLTAIGALGFGIFGLKRPKPAGVPGGLCICTSRLWSARALRLSVFKRSAYRFA